MSRAGPAGAARGRIGRAPAAAALALALIAFGADLARPPERQLMARALVGSIHLYQASVARLWPTLGLDCRFEPSCSHYAEVVILRQGAVRGSLSAVGRVLRCNPWTPRGTVDMPPPVSTDRAVAALEPSHGVGRGEAEPWGL